MNGCSENNFKGVYLIEKILTLFRFADDIDVVTESKEDLQKHLVITGQTLKEYSMTIKKQEFDVIVADDSLNIKI